MSYKEKIYLDSCIILDYLEGKDIDGSKEILNAYFNKSRSGEVVIFTSVLTISEVLYLGKPLEANVDKSISIIKSFWDTNRTIQIIQFDEPIAIKSRDLAWKLVKEQNISIKPADLIQITSAINIPDLNTFYTNDKKILNAKIYNSINGIEMRISRLNVALNGNLRLSC